MKFRPSTNILEKIAEEPHSPLEPLVVQYTEFPQELTHEQMDATIRTFIPGIAQQIAAYYRFGIGSIGEIMELRKMMLVAEALKNEFVHGMPPYQLRLFLGQSGVCYGFYDGGNFFRSTETKRLFESKTPLPKPEETKIIRGSPCFGMGTGIIYENADMIEVDAKEGVLYCVQFKTSLARK